MRKVKFKIVGEDLVRTTFLFSNAVTDSEVEEEILEFENNEKPINECVSITILENTDTNILEDNNFTVLDIDEEEDGFIATIQLDEDYVPEIPVEEYEQFEEFSSPESGEDNGVLLKDQDSEEADTFTI
jgi:hypothetical protein